VEARDHAVRGAQRQPALRKRERRLRSLEASAVDPQQEFSA
jgi:hypothetical protein